MSHKKTKEHHLLQGTYQPSVHNKQTPQYPSLTGIADTPPPYLKKESLREWKRLADHLEEAGMLKPVDVSSFSYYCLMYSRWRQASIDIEKRGLEIVTPSGRIVSNPSVKHEILYGAAMQKAGAKFGLNPLDRPRVIVTADKNEPDLYDRFVAGEDISALETK